MKKENKQISILTFHYAHNYGAMLQAFGLRKFLENKGYSVKIINYVPDHMRLKYFHVSPIRIILSMKRSTVNSFFRQISNIEHFNNFEIEFLDTNPRKPLSRENLKGELATCEYVIFGSDQIWNTFITKNDTTYFADFLEDGNAIAYAASCGNALASESFNSAVTAYSKHFKRISVREKNAKDFLKSSFDINAECVLDPVFLLSSDFWLELAEQGKMETIQNYILFYTVQDNLELVAECNTFADENGMKVYSIHGEMKKCNDKSELRAGVGPLEFLYHIKHAKYIYTNSFHAVAFSILFQKKAYVRVHSETGNRIVDLLNECGITWDGQGLLEVDGSMCLESLYEKIEESKKFLLDCIEKD